MHFTYTLVTNGILPFLGWDLVCIFWMSFNSDVLAKLLWLLLSACKSF